MPCWIGPVTIGLGTLALSVSGVAPRRSGPAYKVPTDEVVVLDPDMLEHGSTEMIPVMPRPRWTPDFGRLPSVMTEQPRSTSIAPRAQRDQVAGEIDVTGKPK